MENQNTVVEMDMNGVEYELTSVSSSYCSMKANTTEEKVAFYNAINSPTKRLKECVNMEIALKDVYAERCTTVDVQTGEVRPMVRLVLIDDKGVSYGCCSKGTFSALQKLFSVFGTPDRWEDPIIIRPKTLSKGVNQNVLTFDLVGVKKLPKK